MQRTEKRIYDHLPIASDVFGWAFTFVKVTHEALFQQLIYRYVTMIFIKSVRGVLSKVWQEDFPLLDGKLYMESR